MKQKYLVSKQFCDMRNRSMDLLLIVTSQFNMNVLDHSLFILFYAHKLTLTVYKKFLVLISAFNSCINSFFRGM